MWGFDWDYLYVIGKWEKEQLFHFRFICKNNGVLFENDLLQIGVKSEYRQNLGRLGIFYGNKTSFQFSGFSVDTQCPGDLGSHILFFIWIVCICSVILCTDSRWGSW
jgi:hypothetical protein